MTNAKDFLNRFFDRMSWEQVTTLETQSPSNELRKGLRLLNTILETVEGIDDWPLLRKDGKIVLVAGEESDTTAGSEEYVTATQNSDEVTVDNATFDDSYKNRAFQVVGDSTWYRIVDVLSATQLKLDRAWVADSITAADEKTYKIGVDQYSLPTDFGRPITDMQNHFGTVTIQPVSPNKFAEIRRTSNGITFGDPKYYTIYGMNDARTAWTIHFHPWPSTARVLTLPYQMLHPTIDSDNDKILFPSRYNAVLMDIMLQLAYRDHEDSDTEKIQQTLIDMLRKYNEQTPTVTDGRPVMRPSKSIRNNIRASAQRSGIRIDYGDHFDKAGNIRLT